MIQYQELLRKTLETKGLSNASLRAVGTTLLEVVAQMIQEQGPLFVKDIAQNFNVVLEHRNNDSITTALIGVQTLIGDRYGILRSTLQEAIERTHGSFTNVSFGTRRGVNKTSSLFYDTEQKLKAYIQQHFSITEERRVKFS